MQLTEFIFYNNITFHFNKYYYIQLYRSENGKNSNLNSMQSFKAFNFIQAAVHDINGLQGIGDRK